MLFSSILFVGEHENVERCADNFVFVERFDEGE